MSVYQNGPWTVEEMNHFDHAYIMATESDGSRPQNNFDVEPDTGGRINLPMAITAHHGADPAEWPAWMRVQQFPEIQA